MCPIYIYKLVANKIKPLSVEVSIGHALQFCKGAIRQPLHFRVHIRQSGPQQTTRNGGLTMNFSVEEENLICMYHTSDRRRTMARMLTALPDMDTEMRRLANGTIAKLEHMTDADFDGQRFDFTGE